MTKSEFEAAKLRLKACQEGDWRGDTKRAIESQQDVAPLIAHCERLEAALDEAIKFTGIELYDKRENTACSSSGYFKNSPNLASYLKEKEAANG